MHGPELLLLLLGALVVTSIARRLNFSAPLVLVAVGLVVSFIPGVPEFELDPHLILLVVLPPLLYSAALDSSYLNIRANLRPIGLLAVGLVLFTTFVVGVTANLVFPDLPFAAALVLGAVVAPPDAVAAVAIGRRLGLQRRAMTLLVGESLINDATALTAFKVAVAARRAPRCTRSRASGCSCWSRRVASRSAWSWASWSGSCAGGSARACWRARWGCWCRSAPT